ncbi:hypothetical protein EQG49_12225 [Periweissella cryptocerci]|uniref:Uncharacterized protein n=1 Tax=Periweissella cryptocerci TaxID=2506420 RepID=A0A4P6YWE5_9LACO|nr:hypothetical protein [Periweissella cryptocerci]QBO37164.1 hypothetical protein EQG49_12225 [Periweissella cryptocerci]
MTQLKSFDLLWIVGLVLFGLGFGIDYTALKFFGGVLFFGALAQRYVCRIHDKRNAAVKK